MRSIDRILRKTNGLTQSTKNAFEKDAFQSNRQAFLFAHRLSMKGKFLLEFPLGFLRFENKKDFDVLLKSWSLGKEFEDLIFAFVVYNGGSESIPLYTTHQHFICNQNGSTFEKIKP